MMLQYMKRLEKNGKISSDERMRLKDEIETKNVILKLQIQLR